MSFEGGVVCAYMYMRQMVGEERGGREMKREELVNKVIT